MHHPDRGTGLEGVKNAISASRHIPAYPPCYPVMVVGMAILTLFFCAQRTTCPALTGTATGTRTLATT